MSGEVQTIIFEKTNYTLPQAKKWLKSHDYKTDPDIKPTQFRFRQKEPNFKKYVTKKISKGLNIVIGYG